MSVQSRFLYDSQFTHICRALFEIANYEHQHRTNRFLHRASRRECTDFEWRFLRIDNIMRGLLNTTFSLNISLSLISQFPSDEYMHQYHYSAKGYALYHYSVICHELSTIRDLYRKLVNEVCKCGIKPDSNGNISWRLLESQLKSNAKFSNVLTILDGYHNKFDKYIKDRQQSSHEGFVFNNIFSQMDLTDLITNYVDTGQLRNLDAKFVKYVRGTKENLGVMNESKQEYVKFLSKIIEDSYDNACKLFNVLQAILLDDIETDLSSYIKCWDRVPLNSFDKIEDYLREVLKTQVLVYYVEPEQIQQQTETL